MPVESTVPAGEIERRLTTFQKALGEAEMDGAVIVQSADLYYLTGTTQNAHLVLPTIGEPVLLVRRTVERARIESPLDLIVPMLSLYDLMNVMCERDVRRRVGFELDVLPAARYLRYREILDGIEIGDCSSLLREVRAEKSDWELARIREAAAMVSGVAARVAEVLRPGISEVALAAEIEYWLRRQGHQGILRLRAFNGEVHYGTIVSGPNAAVPGAADAPLVGSGINPYVGKGSGLEEIRPGAPVIIDIVGASHGYVADQTRTFCVGHLDSNYREAYQLSLEIMRRVAGAAAVGVPACDLYELAVELAGEQRDMLANFSRVSFIGHGIGLELDEIPLLAKGHSEPLREGMVVAIEPKFIFPGRGAVGVENSYYLSRGGLEKLTTAPEEICEL